MRLADTLRAEIAANGPITVERWMERCNAQYYSTRDPLGTDFVTAPEISQMFGELIGLWFAELWTRAGSPAAARLIELGPGRGTLMADLLRATRGVTGFPREADVHLVETSPLLRKAQTMRLPGATCHERLEQVPTDRPALIVANEFFDALPVRQFAMSSPPNVGSGEEDVHERTIYSYGACFAADAAQVVREDCPAGRGIAAMLGTRLAASGGAALIVDYGYVNGPAGDTLQAMRRHAPADPFADPGETDLTALVDFGALAIAARPATVHGPVAQGVWLERLGIAARAQSLKRGRSPGEAAEIEAGRQRLTAPALMGMSFKVMALTAPDWPVPAGFEA